MAQNKAFINFKVFCLLLSKTYIFDKFQSTVNHWRTFYEDLTRIKSLLKRLKNIGMRSEKIYPNTLNQGQN